MLFMKYNAESIREETGRAPIRAYYCNGCCCWHLTSKPRPSLGAKNKHKPASSEREIERAAKLAIRRSQKRRDVA